MTEEERIEFFTCKVCKEHYLKCKCRCEVCEENPFHCMCGEEE